MAKGTLDVIDFLCNGVLGGYVTEATEKLNTGMVHPLQQERCTVPTR
jgi:hypothetical protein